MIRFVRILGHFCQFLSSNFRGKDISLNLVFIPIGLRTFYTHRALYSGTLVSPASLTSYTLHSDPHSPLFGAALLFLYLSLCARVCLVSL